MKIVANFIWCGCTPFLAAILDLELAKSTWTIIISVTTNRLSLRNYSWCRATEVHRLTILGVWIASFDYAGVGLEQIILWVKLHETWLQSDVVVGRHCFLILYVMLVHDSWLWTHRVVVDWERLTAGKTSIRGFGSVFWVATHFTTFLRFI